MATLRLEIYLLLSALLLPLLFILPEARARLKSLLLPLLTMIAITTLLHLVFPPAGGETLLSVGSIQISDLALWRAAMFSWRILLFMLLAVLLTVAIGADELAQACWRGLARLRLPLAGIGAALFLAIRFLPELAQHYEQVRTAQQMRGAKFSGGLLRRTRLSLPLVVPVVVAALRKAETLSDCLLVRGWGSARRRTFFGEWRLRASDWLLFLGLLLLLVAIAILIR
jgi:energy-coupling factor transport system permease protein